MTAPLRASVAAFFGFVAWVSLARADEPFDSQAILGKKPAYVRFESIDSRMTAFDQRGTGYQSQAGSQLRGPGSERATIFEPIIDAVILQGSRLKHRVTIPVDIVSAASPDSVDKRRDPKVDVISSASRKNLSATLDVASTYQVTSDTDFSFRSGLHIEEPFRSWHGGLAGSHTLRDGTATISASVLQVFDWFDDFDDYGYRTGRTTRSSTTGSAGISEILTPTTSASVNYGITVQQGQLSNTWNTVPLERRPGRAEEIVPDHRVRHALVGRLSQFLPWNGALHLYLRLYDDDWSILAQSAQVELMQRITPWLYVAGLYRHHHQDGARFFTTLAPPTAEFRTADSDLASLTAHTVGGKLALDVPVHGWFRTFHFDVAYERYTRNNDLKMDVVTCGSGYRF